MGVVAAGLGIAFGIAVTIGTVVMPRKAELRRETVEGPPVPSISIEGAMKAVDPKLVWLGKQETQDRQLWIRLAQGQFERIPGDDQGPFGPSKRV